MPSPRVSPASPTTNHPIRRPAATALLRVLAAALLIGVAGGAARSSVAHAQLGSVTTNGPYTAAPGQSIFMNGSIAIAGVTASQWLWSFGDGTTGSGQSVQKAYSAAGTYVITLQVQTNQGVLSTSTSATIIGGSTSGQVSAGGPYSGAAGQAITMNAFINQPGVAVAQWTWTFGDGTSASGQSVQKTYTAAGTYTVTVQAQGPLGAAGAVTASTTATITASGSTTTPTTPGATASISLLAGCNNVAVTWANGTPPSTLAAAVSPAGALTGIWYYSQSTQTYLGYAPNAPAAANDLRTLNRLDAVFVCTNAPATITRPAL